MEPVKDIIQDFKNIFSNCFESERNRKFWITGFNQQILRNTDESRVDILVVNFRNYPLDDSEEDIQQYIIESVKFEKYFIDQVQKLLQIELKSLQNDNNGHYFYNENGDTISVHFNDSSLIYIETYTGQY